MNKSQFVGTVNQAAGTLLELLGKITRNTTRQHAGARRQIRGRSQSAIGEAQQLIKLCAKRSRRRIALPT